MNTLNINWYPGHMVKAKKEMINNLKYIDIVYELIDARMPNSSKIQDVDKIIKDKLKIIVVTKYDLCDKIETDKWIKYYETKGNIIVINNNIKKLITKTLEVTNYINELRLTKNLKKRKIRVLIIGIPNVGKSTLINKLAKKQVVRIGNIPGITRHLNWIRLNKDLELLDTPGILWPKLEQKIVYNLASLTSIKEEIIPLDEIAKYILETLFKYYPNILFERYNLKNVNNLIEAYEVIGNKFGCLKQGEIDYDRVINLIINDLKKGIIKNITFDRFGE